MIGPTGVAIGRPEFWAAESSEARESDAALMREGGGEELSQPSDALSEPD